MHWVKLWEGDYFWRLIHPISHAAGYWKVSLILPAVGNIPESAETGTNSVRCSRGTTPHDLRRPNIWTVLAPIPEGDAPVVQLQTRPASQPAYDKESQSSTKFIFTSSLKQVITLLFYCNNIGIFAMAFLGEINIWWTTYFWQNRLSDIFRLL